MSTNTTPNNTSELPALQQLDINATDAFVVKPSVSSVAVTEDIDMADQDPDDPLHPFIDYSESDGQVE